jgi:two-component system autoinducer 2 sensor kinase/phosphatase LuxQ
MGSDKQQLDFIEAVSKYVDLDFRTPQYLRAALKALSNLLGSNRIAISSIYPDEKNKEIQLKSYFYTANKESEPLDHLVNKFSVDKISKLLTTFQLRKDEMAVDYETLILNLSNEKNPNIIASNTHTPFFVASYSVLKSYFVNTFQLERAFIEKHTLQTVLDLMPQRVFWKNRESVYMGCNKAFAQDASLKNPDDIVGITDHEIFPEQAELYCSDDAKTMETREHLISSEEPQTHQDGNTIWLRTSKRPIINKDNTVVGIVGTYDDISELKNTQQALNLAKIDLEQRVEERTHALTAANQKLEVAILELKSTQDHLIETEKMAALGTLVTGVSHEINTPLGIAVTGASHLEFMSTSLKDKVTKGNISKTKFLSSCDEIIRSSDLILRNLERADELIQNFKMMAIDQSKDEIRQIILNKYLHDIVNAMAPQANKKNIKIFVKGDEALSISTYPGAIAQIFTILIANAILHGFSEQESGEIHIAHTMVGEDLQLSFEDNGSGISQDKLTKIFQPFYTTNRTQGGTGLGLSIVFNLVTQRLNGKVTCESEPNQWTRFSIIFPIK